MKTCVVCNVLKLKEDFYAHPSAKDGKRRECKECSLFKSAKRHRNMTEEQKLKKTRWKSDYNKSEKRLRKILDYNLARYGLTYDSYNEMAMRQGNKCAICGEPHDPSKNRGRLYVDHCHVTGVVRGLLCKKCNSLLGFARDSKDLMLKAIKYLSSDLLEEYGVAPSLITLIEE